MTKDELVRVIKLNKGWEVSWNDVLTAVDAYTAAIIAQSKCSTLREAVEQELMLLQKRIALWPEGSLESEMLYAQKDTYQKVLSFIKDMSPVA